MASVQNGQSKQTSNEHREALLGDHVDLRGITEGDGGSSSHVGSDHHGRGPSNTIDRGPGSEGGLVSGEGGFEDYDNLSNN